MCYFSINASRRIIKKGEEQIIMVKYKIGIINKARIRDYTELSVSDEVEIELEKKVEEIIKKAEERAKNNNRRTIFSRDL